MCTIITTLASFSPVGPTFLLYFTQPYCPLSPQRPLLFLPSFSLSAGTLLLTVHLLSFPFKPRTSTP